MKSLNEVLWGSSSEKVANNSRYVSCDDGCDWCKCNCDCDASCECQCNCDCYIGCDCYRN